MWLSTSCRTSCRAKCPERVQRPEEGSGQEDETVLRDSFILGDVFGMSASLSLLQNSTHFLQGSHGGKFSSYCLTALPFPRTLPVEVTFPAALLFLTLVLIIKKKEWVPG